MLVIYPIKKRRMINEDNKLYENKQDPMVFRAPESHFHYICLEVYRKLSMAKDVFERCKEKQIRHNELQFGKLTSN